MLLHALVRFRVGRQKAPNEMCLRKQVMHINVAPCAQWELKYECICIIYQRLDKQMFAVAMVGSP